MANVATLVEEAQKLSEAEKVQLVGELLHQGGILWLAKSLSALEDKLGVKAAAPVGPAATTSTTAAKTEAPTAFDVILKNAGANKINVIKAVRAATSLGLKEAKDLVDKGGQKVKTGVPKDEAEKLAKELKDAGADVEIKGQ